jgi:enoyl-CoA hydratase
VETAQPTGPESVVLEGDLGPLRYLSLNRPHKSNALSRDLLTAFDSALDRAEADSAVRVVIIRGMGKGFSAGFDLAPGSYTPGKQDDLLDDRENVHRAVARWLRVWEFPKPTIAQVHGYCIAGATQLAVVCDMTVVADDTIIGGPSLPLGGGFISPLWVHLVGPKRAKEISYVAGSRISGSQAAAWGWANRAVPVESLEQEVRDLGLRVAATPPGLLRMKKVAINRVVELAGFRMAAMLAAEVNALLHHSPQSINVRDTIADYGLKGAIERFEHQFDDVRQEAVTTHERDSVA